MQAVVQSSLQKLDADALRPFDAVIDFARLPSFSEIQALGRVGFGIFEAVK